MEMQSLLDQSVEVSRSGCRSTTTDTEIFTVLSLGSKTSQLPSRDGSVKVPDPDKEKQQFVESSPVLLFGQLQAFSIFEARMRVNYLSVGSCKRSKNI